MVKGAKKKFKDSSFIVEDNKLSNTDNSDVSNNNKYHLFIETENIVPVDDYESTIAGENELYAEERDSKPWWKSHFFLSKPVLFGTWDGVFTSCLINIFGVIIFLRSGWIIAQAGLIYTILLILTAVIIVLTSILSAIGICERCQVESGGVYFLLSHVLGSQIGGAVGIIYCFGQSVGCALCVTGFSESISHLIELQHSWLEKGIAVGTLILLSSINLAGVKWVVKLQFGLLLILVLSVFDFIIGSFIHKNNDFGFEGWNSFSLWNNTFPAFTNGNNWFTVFGVFFPTLTGVMAGINMSGDLSNPSDNIPTGTLWAVAVGTFIYLTFTIILGGTCQRLILYTDYLIVQKISYIGILLLAGFYISSLSSGLASLYGTPRVLQSIANQKVIPIIEILGKGRGPNRIPVLSILVISLITTIFILIGQINRLAPIVTMPFLITYAYVDYAYFVLAQTFDLQWIQEAKFKNEIFSDSSNKDKSVDHLGKLFPERKLKSRNKELQINLQNEDINLYPIIKQQRSHYSPFCNRWVSYTGCLSKLILMFLVHWGYALSILFIILILYLYIGKANPGLFSGIASEFHIKSSQRYNQILIAPCMPDVQIASSQINEENRDFSGRSKYHQTFTPPKNSLNNKDLYLSGQFC